MDQSPQNTLTFEQALAELERVVQELEDGQTGLEESLARYEIGINLLRRCYDQLKQAEQRIMLVTGEDAEGHPIAQPFDHAATVAKSREQGAKSREQGPESREQGAGSREPKEKSREREAGRKEQGTESGY